MNWLGGNRKYKRTLSLLDECVGHTEESAEESRAMRKELERFTKADEEIRKTLGKLGRRRDD